MMRRLPKLIVFVALGLMLVGTPGAAQEQRQVLVLTAQGPLTSGMAEYLDRGLAKAEQEQFEALIFQLDTPGGSVDLMERMVQAIRSSRVPVVVYITPRGAIAGSAGTVLTLAGHAAAMAPETAIGAASPVGGQGEDLGETLEAKAKEILKAQVRALAERRGDEAVALAEDTIETARAVSVGEALEAGLIDFIASDLDDLLEQMDGFEVELVEGRTTLDTAGAQVVEFAQSLIEQLLHVLTNPNVIFLLLSVGVQAILIEISSPGGWVAGFIGVICLSLATLGLGVLPVNWFGLIFLVTAFVLFLLDIKAPTHGALTAAGLGSFIVGALVLFNSPGTPSFQRVSVPLVIGVALVSAAFFMTIVTFAIRAQRRPVETGAESLVGRKGEARTDLAPTGMVQVAGELWTAYLERGHPDVTAGEQIEVLEVEGLRLKVKSLSKKPG